MTVRKTTELVLGTVQWGMPYGISNRTGVPSTSEIGVMLTIAAQQGVSKLDTAAAYGDAERTLGAIPASQAFNIITKIPALHGAHLSDESIRKAMEHFSQSLKRLNRKSVYGLLVHAANDLVVPGGDRLFDALLQLKKAGKVQKIGVSVYTPADAEQIINKFPIDVVQIPLNILDQRMKSTGVLTRLRELGIEVHARSVFLQGLLTENIDSLHPYFSPIRHRIAEIHEAARARGLSVLEAAIVFVRDIPEVDAIVLGNDNLSQLRLNLRYFQRSTTFDAEDLACNDPSYINPSLWKVQ